MENTKQAHLVAISRHLKISQTYAEKSANSIKASMAEKYGQVSIDHAKKAREHQEAIATGA